MAEDRVVGFSVVNAFIWIVKWFSFERAIGFGLLFSGGILLFEPLRAGSLVQAMADATGLDVIMISHWYTLSALYLLHKGQKSSFGAILLCITPMVLLIITATYLAFISNDPSIQISGSDIAREVLLNALIIQHLLRKLTVELVEKFPVFGSVQSNRES